MFKPDRRLCVNTGQSVKRIWLSVDDGFRIIVWFQVVAIQLLVFDCFIFTNKSIILSINSLYQMEFWKKFLYIMPANFLSEDVDVFNVPQCPKCVNTSSCQIITVFFLIKMIHKQCVIFPTIGNSWFFLDPLTVRIKC